MEISQRQIFKVIKNEYAYALKDVKCNCQGFGYTAKVLEETTAKGRKK